MTFGKKKNTNVGVDYLNSMVFVRLNEIERLLIEYRVLYMTCSYYSISRQLRFMLESVIQSYYIDTEYPKIGMLGKLSVLKQMKRDRKAIGRPLVNMTNLGSDVKEKIISLYRELSDVVHPDYQDYIPFARPTEKEEYFNWISRLVLLPNPKVANYCLEKLNEVMDIVYFLIFESFGSVALIGLPRFEEVLHKANCELSLNFVYKHQDSIH